VTVELTRRKAMADLEDIAKKYADLIDNPEVKSSSYSLNSLSMLKPELGYLKEKGIRSMIDMGCGYGVLGVIIGEFLGAKKLYAVDVDEHRLSFLEKLKERSSMNIIPIRQDFTKPLDINEKVDLLISLGALEHSAGWDEAFERIREVLIEGGYVLISMPNLGSWVNRLALLLGYQPRDLEISRKKLYGVAPPFKGHGTINHVKVATYRAFKEFLLDHGFEIVMATPLYSKQSLLINLIDRVLATPMLSRRFVVLAKLVK
jgi:SAM-dependent methyltransferase